MNPVNIKQKIGRNSPCYCGSQIKYKRCHLVRHLEPVVTEGQVREYSSKRKLEKKCFHAEVDALGCKGKIIDAHTVSKSGSLRGIASNGKVYNFTPSINSLFDNNGMFNLREIGIGQASTFPGFCAHHDKQLFAPIEDCIFEANAYNATLLGYRAISNELSAKNYQMQGVPFLKTMDKGQAER
jgi:SEC-C motif